MKNEVRSIEWAKNGTYIGITWESLGTCSKGEVELQKKEFLHNSSTRHP